MNEVRTSKYPEKHGVPKFEGLQAINPPNQIHPAHIREDQAESISGVGWARSFLQEATQAWEGINAMRTTRDPEVTEDGHVLKVNKTVSEQAQRLEKSLDKARENLNMSRTKYRQEIADAAKLNPSPHDAEVRTVLRGMKDSDRHTAILEAIQTGDRELLGAAFNGPAIAAGLTKDMQRDLRRKYEQKANPKAFEALEAVTRAEEKALDAFMEFSNNTGKLGAEDRASKIRQKQAEARKAASAFAA